MQMLALLSVALAALFLPSILAEDCKCKLASHVTGDFKDVVKQKTLTGKFYFDLDKNLYMLKYTNAEKGHLIIVDVTRNVMIDSHADHCNKAPYVHNYFDLQVNSCVPTDLPGTGKTTYHLPGTGCDGLKVESKNVLTRGWHNLSFTNFAETDGEQMKNFGKEMHSSCNDDYYLG